MPNNNTNKTKWTHAHICISIHIYTHICLHTGEEKEDMVIQSKKVLNREATTALETLLQIKVDIK